MLAWACGARQRRYVVMVVEGERQVAAAQRREREQVHQHVRVERVVEPAGEPTLRYLQATLSKTRVRIECRVLVRVWNTRRLQRVANR